MKTCLQAHEIFGSFEKEMPANPSHDQNQFNNGSHQCQMCNMVFLNEEDIVVHRNVHESPFKCLTEAEICLRRDLLYEEVKKQQDEDIQRAIVSPSPIRKPRRIYKPRSKRVGFTKIKMEDCLRCDACSCIYIDPEDYHKHMRNFHQRYNTVIPRSRRKANDHLNYNITTQIATPPIDPNSNSTETDNNEPQSKPEESLHLQQLLSDYNIRELIKHRWSRVVSERLILPEKVKDEPEDDFDYSYLLGNVEVKIKTEPPE